MDTNERILLELQEIKRYLKVLSREKQAEFEREIQKEFVTSKEREIMYSMFDGTNSLADIAQKAGTSSEAVRLFAIALEKAELLEYIETKAKTKYPKRLF